MRKKGISIGVVITESEEFLGVLSSDLIEKRIIDEVLASKK